ncbi:MAG: hypothetical protein ACOC7T_02850 [Planctomycetota bacterium]
MPGEADEHRPGNDSERPTADEAWEGMPLELESSTERPTPVGEETVERPVSELVPSGGHDGGAAWLARWLLFTAVVALALSATSLVLAALNGSRPAPWRGGLLAFQCAVLLLLLRTCLTGGATASETGRWGLSLAGAGAGAFILTTVGLQSATEFIHAFQTPTAVLTELSIGGFLGLAVLVIFVQCYRGYRWAGRVAAVVAVGFCVLAPSLYLTGRSPVTASLSTAIGMPPDCWIALGGAVLGTAAFVVAREWADDGPARLLGAAVPLAVVAVAAVFMGWVLSGAPNPETGANRAAVLAGVWIAAALLPVAVVGAVAAWRTNRPLRDDVAESSRFLWILIALGIVAIVAVWLPHALSGDDSLRASIEAAGILALAAGAWFGVRGGDWGARWALVPVGALTLAVGCALPVALRYANRLLPRGGSLWHLLVAFGWFSMLVGLAFASAGLLVKRYRARRRERGDALWGDLDLLTFVGIGLTGTGLALIFALWAGRPETVSVLRQALQTVGHTARELLAVATGPTVQSLILRGSARAANWVSQWSAPAAGAILLGLMLTVHLIAASRARWGMYVVGAAWVLPLTAVTSLACVYAVRLLFPQPQSLQTAAARYVASHPSARLLLLGALAAAVTRLWEAVGSTLSLSRSEAPPAGHSPTACPPGRQRHLALLIAAGLGTACLALVFAIVWWDGPAVMESFRQMGQLGSRWLGRASAMSGGVGGLVATSPLCAGAVLLTGFVLIAVHREGIRGRLTVYPLLGAVWLALMGALDFHWAMMLRATPLSSPVGRFSALAVTGLAFGALTLATLSVWARWWRLGDRSERTGTPSRGRRDDSASAHSLGSVGLAAVLLLGAAVCHAAFSTNAGYAEWAAGTFARVQTLLQDLLFEAERLRAALSPGGADWVPAAAMAAVAGALFLVHYASRHPVRWARTVLFALWTNVALVGIAAAVYTLVRRPAGAWTGGQIVLWLLLVALTLRAVVGLANAACWLTETPRP